MSFSKISAIILFIAEYTVLVSAEMNTIAYIISNNYPAEEHTIYTADSYILTLFRIPDSPWLRNTTKNTQSGRKPAVLLQHGFVLTSDAWVLSDASAGLAYLLADAGYDVWLGNQRGNTYSRNHRTLSAEKRPFWNFSWHEIGYYDLAAMFDHILSVTQESALHYVGYSQGTSALLVLLSERPEYNDKVHTTHLLAPVAYMQRMQQPLAKLGSMLLNVATMLANTLGYREVLDYTQQPLHKKMCEYVCSNNSPLQFLCSKLYELIGGPGTQHLNASLTRSICESHPAGASTKQILHFLQVYKSGKFLQFDYGEEMNIERYKRTTPPMYNISDIKSCLNLYYSHNDYMSAAEDVEDLAQELPCAQLIRIPHEDWNHYDFLWSKNIKEVLNDQIISKIDSYENLHVL